MKVVISISLIFLSHAKLDDPNMGFTTEGPLVCSGGEIKCYKSGLFKNEEKCCKKGCARVQQLEGLGGKKDEEFKCYESVTIIGRDH